MDLSIVVPAYNSAEYIKKCLLSCCKQDLLMSDYEIIVVDDGSTDNTKEIVCNLQKEYDNVKYIYQENAAQGAARNNGLRQALGRYVWFVDSDDWIKENCLDTIITTLKKNDLNGVTVGHATLCGQELKRWRTFDESEVLSGKELLSKSIFLISPTYTIWERSHLVNNKLFFKEKLFHEDSEICPRLYYVSNRIGFINDLLYFVYQNPVSTTRGANPKRAFDIVTVVRELSRFSTRIKEKNILIQLNNYISEAINASLYNTYKFDREQIKNLNKLWNVNRDLFKHLINSNIMKYKFEGLLFLAFSCNISIVYRSLQCLNKTPGGMKRK